MASNTSLYGVARPKSNKAKEISSSTTLAFTTQLSSLISKDAAPSRQSAGRTRQSKSKSNIFTTHNRNTHKRAAVDISEDGAQIHQSTDIIGGVDAAMLHRSKRKMEEKARLYASMKRGDYVRDDERREGEGLVDFDRKWAEREGEANYQLSGSDSDDAEEAGSNDDAETVEYEDEFGRQRHGTKAEAAREQRRRIAQANAQEDLHRFSARPSQPQNLIYGDTVQAAAFNPDEHIAAQMAGLAEKRDRSATPPDESHYDASAEVRTKGTGFYSFSKDAQARREEMGALEREREETERGRREREGKKEKRRKELVERRNMIREQRGKMKAERFLDELGVDLRGGDEGVGEEREGSDVGR